ncbi:MAG: universal stress protein [Deltaproteobacteria bacterium]|nr:universal stress protein [Deltaproteobacteria bacterium]
MEKHKRKPIIAAVDGSPHSHKVADFASRLAHAFETRLALLHVVEPLPHHMVSSFGMAANQWLQTQLREGQAVLDELCQELQLADVDKILSSGPVPETICGEAEEANAEMIVLGAHGHGPVPRIMLGSVGDRVASLASRTVTIVR